MRHALIVDFGGVLTTNVFESFRDFCDRTSDDELGSFAGREPARGREREEVAA